MWLPLCYMTSTGALGPWHCRIPRAVHLGCAESVVQGRLVRERRHRRRRRRDVYLHFL